MSRHNLKLESDGVEEVHLAMNPGKGEHTTASSATEFADGGWDIDESAGILVVALTVTLLK
jgi:hypothetical protein